MPQSFESGSASATFEDGSTLNAQFQRNGNRTSGTIRYDHDADASTPARTVEYTNGSAVWQDENGRRVSLPANVAEEALAAIRAISSNRSMEDRQAVAQFANDPVANRTRWAR